MIDILRELTTICSEQMESDTLEFKNFESENALYGSKDLTDEITALANTKGGNILIGVVDNSDASKINSQLKGFPVVDVHTTKDRLLGKINPRIDLKVENISFEGSNFVNISVPKSMHSLVSSSGGKTCIRIGKSSTPAKPDEIERLVKSLQTYDWSDEDICYNAVDVLDELSIMEAKKEYVKLRNLSGDITDIKFLESVGATKNGVLNKAGLIFLGKSEKIKEILGNYEYRFSWKTKSGALLKNVVWSSNLWNTIKLTKELIAECNTEIVIDYENKDYKLKIIDEVAFHEGYLNALVHRDYNEEGMVAINYFKNKLSITNPGTFYGGVSSQNISYHEPRHRNKVLAKILMEYQLVDRAGMGILRMSINSLKYGRSLPSFIESNKYIDVTMQAEYMKTGVFLITQGYLKDCGLPELIVINSIYEVGYINIVELEDKLENVIKEPWGEIEDMLKDPKFSKYIELRANNDGVYLAIKRVYDFLFDVDNPLRQSSNSQKHIKLFRLLKTHGACNNEVIKKYLGYKSSGATASFLKKAKYVVNDGQSRTSIWRLA